MSKVALCAGALLVSIFLLLPGRSPENSPSSPIGAAGKPVREATLVHTVVVTAQAFDESITAVGTVRADESVDVQAEISGKLTKIHFQEGTLVHAGDLLVVINDAELRATLKRAVYRRELSALKLRRIATLIGLGGVPQQEYDIAASELQVLGAEVDLIEAQLAHTEIRAPFDGIIGLRHVSEGAFITPATRIATFQRLNHLKIDFAVPEKYADRIKPDSPVSISVAGGEQPLVGRVYAIDPRIDNATRTMLIRALCPNPSGRLLAGGFVGVRLVLARIPDAILVPSLALVPGMNDKSVYVVENGKAGRRIVQTGVRTESAVQIVAGLKPGDMVITSGLQQVRTGQPVHAMVDGSVETTQPEPQALVGHQPGPTASAAALN